MKSSKKLLLAAIAASTLCQSGASALPTAGGIGVGTGIVVVGVVLTTLDCYPKGDKNAKKKIVTCPCVIQGISQEVENRVKATECTEEKIVKLIGEKKCDVLHIACEKFSYPLCYEGDTYMADKERFIPSITSLELRLSTDFFYFLHAISV